MAPKKRTKVTLRPRGGIPQGLISSPINLSNAAGIQIPAGSGGGIRIPGGTSAVASPARQIVSSISPATNVPFILNGVENYRPNLGGMTLQQNRSLFRAGMDQLTGSAGARPVYGPPTPGPVYGPPNPVNPVYGPPSPTTPLMPAAALQANPAQIVNPGATGFLGRLGFGQANAAATSGPGMFIRNFGGPSVLKNYGLAARSAMGPLSASLFGAPVVDAINIGGKNSAFDRFSTGAARGAGIGAAIGNVIPIPGVGMGIGALAGAGIGGLTDVVLGMMDDSSKSSLKKLNVNRLNKLSELYASGGLSQNQIAQQQAQLNVGLARLGENPSPSDVATLLDDAEMQVQKLAGTNVGKLTAQDMVALQAAIGQYMQPLVQQQQQSGQIAAGLYNQMAGNMNNPAMGDMMRAQAAASQAQADRLSATYMASAQSLPALYGLQQFGQQINQQQAAPSTDLASILAQTQTQP